MNNQKREHLQLELKQAEAYEYGETQNYSGFAVLLYVCGHTHLSGVYKNLQEATEKTEEDRKSVV